MEENKNLTVEEIISRIEQAPKEVQVMVAKAFLRDDIPNEDIQYKFNTDTIEELNDPNEESNVENINVELPEGIGADGFTIRTSKPSNNPNYITTGAGGLSTCIKGYPTDANANVYANCVGHAHGRRNEIINTIRGTNKNNNPTLNCNAENWIERAKAAGMTVGQTPRVGAIGVAMKGATLNGIDGAGHVWVVERVNSDGSTYTSESGYGGKAFWNQTRSNSNGRWGLSSGYTFRGFIYLPADVQNKIGSDSSQPSSNIANKSVDELAREVIAGKYGNGQDRVNALGSRYNEVQVRVNQILAGNKPSQPSTPSQPSGDDLLTLVKKTIRGDFGNGQARRNALGSRYDEVQAQVNKNINAGLTRWDNIRLF